MPRTRRAEQLVLAVGREDVAHDGAAARAERQPFDVRVLAELAADRVSRRCRARPSASPTASVLMRCAAVTIALEQQRRRLAAPSRCCRTRNRRRRSAAARRRRRRARADREPRCRIRAVQAMDDVTAGRALAGPRAIERVRQPGRERRRTRLPAGRGMPCGGIARTLSLRSTRSHVAALRQQIVEAGRFEIHRIDRPAAPCALLWQPTQY